MWADAGLVGLRLLGYPLGDAGDDSRHESNGATCSHPYPCVLRSGSMHQGEHSEQSGEPRESRHRRKSEAHDGQESDHVHMLMVPSPAPTDRPPDG